MTMHAMFRPNVAIRVVTTSATLLALSAGGLPAQDTSNLEVGIGIAAPTGFLNRDGSTAPLARLGVRTDRPGKTVNYRFDLEGMRYGSENGSGESRRSSTFLVGLVYSGIIAPASEASSPYLILGVAAHYLSSSGPDSWPGALFGLRGGFGWQAKMRDVHMALETSVQFTALGLPGGGVGSRTGALVPVTLSFRF
jgi:hypothetical protein